MVVDATSGINAVFRSVLFEEGDRVLYLNVAYGASCGRDQSIPLPPLRSSLAILCNLSSHRFSLSFRLGWRIAVSLRIPYRCAGAVQEMMKVLAHAWRLELIVVDVPFPLPSEEEVRCCMRIRRRYLLQCTFGA